MARKDYYATLGVSRDVSPEEIKKAFRRLARETHPDANPGDPKAEARFREVAEAYEVLSDQDRRRRYDRGDTLDLNDLFSGFGSFDDLLRSVFGESGLFGGLRTEAGPRRGRDVLVTAKVALSEAAFGVATDVRFRTRVLCSVCVGEGAAPGTTKNTCSTCGGGGAVRVARRGMLGSVMTVTTCDRCGGSGQTISAPCPTCAGSGTVDDVRSVKVEVPAGVTDGTRLRLTGQGEAAPRLGPPGDLYVDIAVTPDPRYIRDASDLVYRTSVGMVEAALGAVVEIPLLEGGVERLDIAPGTQPGWVARLRGLGVPHLGRRGRGDLIVQVMVSIPTRLNEEQEATLRSFAAAGGEQPAAPAAKKRKRPR